MTAKTPDNLHGFILLDEQFTDAKRGAGTSVSQAGAEPDQPQPESNSGYLELRQIGEANETTEYRVITVSSGPASNTGQGGAYAWRKTSETNAYEYRGWVPWRHLVEMYKPSSGTAKDLSAVRMSDGTVLIGHTSTNNPKVLHRAPDESSWTQTTIDSGVTITGGASPSALVRVPRDGGERALFLQVQRRGLNPSPADEFTLHVYASDDGGESWTQVVYGGQGWSVPNTSVPRRMTAAYHDGYITVIIDNIDGGAITWYHLVSADMGATWTQVESAGTGTFILDNPQAFTTPLGQVVVVYRKTTDNTIRGVIKSTPYQAIIGNPTAGTLLQLGNRSGLAYSDHWCTLATDGRLYIQAREASGNSDQIDMWTVNPDQLETTYTADRRYFERGALRTGDTTECLGKPGGVNISPPILVEYRDQLLYAGPVASTSGTYKESLWFAHFGGYSSIDWIDIGADKSAGSSRLNHGAMYLPVDIPGNWSNVTTSTSGSFTESITVNGTLNLTAAISGSYSATFDCGAAGNGTSINRVLMFPGVTVTSGGSSANDYINLGGKWADGTNLLNLRLRLSDTTVGLYNVTTASSLFTASGISAGKKDWCIISSYDGGSNCDVAVFWRLSGSQVWAYVDVATFAPSAAGGSVVDNLFVKVDGSFSAINIETGPWAMMGARDIGVLQWPISHPAAWPSALSGRPFGATPHDLTAGRQLYAAGGPAYYGDAWTAPTRYTRGVHNIDPTISPSPAVYWESNGTAEQVIEWDLTENDRPLDGSIGIYLGGCNFRTAYLEEWNGAAWASTATIDLATDSTGLSYSLSGRILTAAGSGTAADRYFHMDEMAGCVVVLDTGGTPEAFRVAQNSEGIWSPSHSRKPLARLEGDVSTVAASGTCDILASSVVVLVHDRTTARTKYRLRIPASQTVPDDGYRIGSCLIGPMAYLPQPYDWGRQMEARPNVELTESRDGRRFATRRGAPRRSVEVSWPGGTDTSHVYGLTPDHYEPASGYAAAGIVGDAQKLEAMLLRADGPRLPAVYVARAPEPGATTQTIIGAGTHLYGRLSDRVRRTAVLGNEYSSEVQTIDSITIEEEV